MLSGTYSTNVFVSGACFTGGPTTVTGNVFLQSGSVLIADDFTVRGNLHVESKNKPPASVADATFSSSAALSE